MSSKVAIIIVNCDEYTKVYFRDCYSSLIHQTYPKELTQIYIVNNGLNSTNRQLTHQIAEQAYFIDLPCNEGWSKANNQALQIAMQSNHDYYIFLNVDTIVDTDWLSQFVYQASQNPSIHIYQSNIRSIQNRHKSSLRNRIHYLGYGFCSTDEQEKDALRPSVPMDFASGASMLVKRNVFENVGLFREEFFMYYDDLEFCWRSRLAGYRIGLAKKSICYHHDNIQKRFRMIYSKEKNRWLTLLSLLKYRTLFLISPALIVVQAITFVYLICNGRAYVPRRWCAYFFQGDTWKLILNRRREIQSLRCKSDQEIVKSFQGGIDINYAQHPLFKLLVNPILIIYWKIMKRFIYW